MAADVIGSPNSGAIVWGSSDQKIVQSEILNKVHLNLRRLSQTRSVRWWESPRVVVKWMAECWPLTALRFTPSCE